MGVGSTKEEDSRDRTSHLPKRRMSIDSHMRHMHQRERMREADNTGLASCDNCDSVSGGGGQHRPLTSRGKYPCTSPCTMRPDPDVNAGNLAENDPDRDKACICSKNPGILARANWDYCQEGACRLHDRPSFGKAPQKCSRHDLNSEACWKDSLCAYNEKSSVCVRADPERRKVLRAEATKEIAEKARQADAERNVARVAESLKQEAKAKESSGTSSGTSTGTSSGTSPGTSTPSGGTTTSVPSPSQTSASAKPPTTPSDVSPTSPSDVLSGLPQQAPFPTKGISATADRSAAAAPTAPKLKELISDLKAKIFDCSIHDKKPAACITQTGCSYHQGKCQAHAEWTKEGTRTAQIDPDYQKRIKQLKQLQCSEYKNIRPCETHKRCQWHQTSQRYDPRDVEAGRPYTGALLHDVIKEGFCKDRPESTVLKEVVVEGMGMVEEGQDAQTIALKRKQARRRQRQSQTSKD